MSDNKILAKRIADLERQLSLTKDLLQSSMLSEATAKQYAEEVDKQNQALMAQVEALRSAGQRLWDSPESTSLEDIKAEADLWLNLKSALEATPQHHLRELRAEAVLDAVNFGRNQTKYFLRSSEDILQQIEQYAEQIRQGGAK